ncbi:PPIC-type PPIASE domain protein [Capnocytophaga sp. oral taxon 863 str. F0517]|uniref:peptidylprolyl isomerase n=1 Tax=Capnocytophaga sp. oral taxon 863 TaxID=1227265 RepID=UPI0003967997|nr:peptidylprolyl isomerase [Capnocytophaga sp. oral taxon 863]ERI63602.1 PPIC-type PPIASE domain protein [Capnocytophaga sp. oral taxon 863 str. F0517]
MNRFRITFSLWIVLLLPIHALWAQSAKTKIDGVASVVGDYLILETDIDRALVELRSQNVDTKNITRCQLLGKLMEDKLYVSQAIQDSIKISDTDIRDGVSRRLEFLVEQLGDMKKVVAFYHKDDEQSLRDELFDILKQNELSSRMKAKIVENIEVTPEEVKQFFNKIPKNELPTIGTELEIAQIVIEPKAPQNEVDKVIEQLKEIKKDIIENGASFSTKAILYSADRATGGKELTFNRRSSFAKEFKDVAFSLQEGEISDPFKTDFGWHILQVVKIRGKEVSVRHILMVPQIPSSSLEEAKKKINDIRDKIINKEFTFAEAAKNFSDEKETREDGGQLLNPEDYSTKFELTRMEPTLYSQVASLGEDEVSFPIVDEDRTGRKMFKIYRVTNRIGEHTADFIKDYTRIRELALKEKQLEAVQKWIKEAIKKTFVSVKGEYRKCNFSNNWLKK